MLSEIQKEEILELISLKQEGPYWDFKKEWYEDGKQPDLLHDIICMANNMENRDAYIIIGIDEEKEYCVNDMSSAENRKNTQMLVNFLRDKKFAGSKKRTLKVGKIGKIKARVILQKKKNVNGILQKYNIAYQIPKL